MMILFLWFMAAYLVAGALYFLAGFAWSAITNDDTQLTARDLMALAVHITLRWPWALVFGLKRGARRL